MELVDSGGQYSLSSLQSMGIKLTWLILQEREKYIETTTDTGNQRMDFRFSY